MIAALLALLLVVAPDCARGLLSSAGPEDLLATPRYVLSFSGAPVSNASAAELLASDGGRGQYHRMRSATGQAFVCSVPTPPKAPAIVAEPAVVLDDRTKLARRTKREHDRRAGLERGLALLEPLKGTCLHLRQGWFTYSFCHGEHIRQYHETRAAGSNQVVEDVASEAYTLGQYGAQRAELGAGSGTSGALRDVLASRSGLPGLEEDDGQRRYLVQRWNGGTICDKTGMERKVEVQNVDRIALIREVSICEYTMVIHTPRLCGEPIFHGGAESDAERNAANIIRCNPIAGDGPARPAAKIDPPVAVPAPEPVAVPAPAPEPDAPPPRATEALQDGQAFQIALDADKLFDPATGEQLTDEELQALTDEGLMLMIDPETGEVILSDRDGDSTPPPSPPSAAKPVPGSTRQEPTEGESADGRRKKQLSVLEQISAILQDSMTAALKNAQQDQAQAVAGGDAVKQLVEKLQAAGHQATILNPNADRQAGQSLKQPVGSSRQHNLAQAYGAAYGAEADETADADARETVRRRDAVRRDEL